MIALPDRLVPVIVWRLWIFFASVVVLERWFASGLHSVEAMAHLPRLAFVDTIASAVADAVVVVVASDRMLRLTALAVGDTYTSDVSVALHRKMWPSLPLGLVIALAPFYVLRQGLSAFFDFEKLATGYHLYDPVVLGFEGVGIVLGFAGVASGAAFLSHAYRSTKPQVC